MKSRLKQWIEDIGWTRIDIQPNPSAERDHDHKFVSNSPGYLIKRGDTLSEIARKSQYNYKEIAKMNNIKDPNIIKAGQKIRIR